MNVPEPHTAAVAQFPAELQALLAAELAAGNAIVEVANCFPAPPAGAYILLARPVSTRPRESAQGLVFYDRNSSAYSGEFTDARRFFFILEPPRSEEPPPDMDAIRARLQTRPEEPRAGMTPTASDPTPTTPLNSDSPSVYQQFCESMHLDYDRWREGTSYAVDLLPLATPAELVRIEHLLVDRPVQDWRDVEALAALNSPKARVILLQVLTDPDPELSTAVLRFAPDLVSPGERILTLVKALAVATTFGGLTPTLLAIEEFHPPEIITALLRGVLRREGAVAVHLAAMALYLHGQAKAPFDWEQRPFLLQFRTESAAEREKYFRELCQRISVDAVTFLAP